MGSQLEQEKKVPVASCLCLRSCCHNFSRIMINISPGMTQDCFVIRAKFFFLIGDFSCLKFPNFLSLGVKIEDNFVLHVLTIRLNS
jgi:hypothetical protein